MGDRSAGGAERRGRPSTQATDAVTISLSELARRMQRQDSAQDVLDTVISAVVGTIPGAEEGRPPSAWCRRVAG